MNFLLCALSDYSILDSRKPLHRIAIATLYALICVGYIRMFLGLWMTAWVVLYLLLTEVASVGYVILSLLRMFIKKDFTGTSPARVPANLRTFESAARAQ